MENRYGGQYTKLTEYGNSEFNINFHNQPHFSRDNIQQGNHLNQKNIRNNFFLYIKDMIYLTLNSIKDSLVIFPM